MIEYSIHSNVQQPVQRQIAAYDGGPDVNANVGADIMETVKGYANSYVRILTFKKDLTEQEKSARIPVLVGTAAVLGLVVWPFAKKYIKKSPVAPMMAKVGKMVGFSVGRKVRHHRKLRKLRKRSRR